MEPGQQEVWRDDLHPGDTATVWSFATHAIDHIETRDLYTLTVRHVMTFPHGKGFVAAVWCGGTGGNSKAYLGTGADAYEKARTEGLEMLAKSVEDLERSVAESQVRLAELRDQPAPEQDGT